MHIYNIFGYISLIFLLYPLLIAVVGDVNPIKDGEAEFVESRPSSPTQALKSPCFCCLRLEYFDEAVRDPASQTAVPVDIHQPPAFLHKILQLNAVQLFYDNTGTLQVENAVLSL